MFVTSRVAKLRVVKMIVIMRVVRMMIMRVVRVTAREKPATQSCVWHDGCVCGRSV